MSLLIILNAVGVGICLLAAILHLMIGLRSQPRNSIQLLFGSMSVLISLYFLTVIGMQAYQDGLVADFPSTAYKYNTIIAFLFPILYVWFIARSTGLTSRRLLVGLSIVYLFLALVVAMSDSPVEFFVATSEPRFQVDNSPLSFAYLVWAILYTYVYFIFSTYAIVKQYRRGEKAAALTLGTAVVIFQITAIFDAITPFVMSLPLFAGQFGFLAFVVVMSLRLSSETIESEKKARRLNFELEDRVEARTVELSAANQALSLSQARIEAQYQATPIPTFTWQRRDNSLVLIDCNRAARDFLDSRTDQFIGRTTSEMYATRPDIVGNLRRSAAEESSFERETVFYESTTDKTHILAMKYTFVSPDLVLVHAEDLTEQRQAEEMLRNAAITAERQRLARELHDSVTQSLYSLTLLASGWKSMSEQGRLDDPPSAFQQLGDVGLQALREMRLLIHQLRPPDLEELGLVQALQKRLDNVEARAGIETELACSGDVLNLPDVMEDQLFGIAQEALNNSLRHAAAHNVVVSVSAENNVVTLSIKDDGKGFNPAHADNGLGLMSMQERAAALGGSYILQTTVQSGTEIRIVVPLSAEIRVREIAR